MNFVNQTFKVFKDYQKFPPKNIISIDKVRLYFNQKGDLLRSETLYSLKTIN